MLRALLACVLTCFQTVTQEPSPPTWRQVELVCLSAKSEVEMEFALVATRCSAPDAKRAFAIVVPSLEGDRTAVERVLEDFDEDALFGADWVIAYPTQLRNAIDIEAVLRAVLHDHALESIRPHLIGVGDGARQALRFVAQQPDIAASVTACAPSADAEIELGSLDALISTPLALVRGREDAREPLLAIVERMLALGRDDVSMDFAATTPHATPRTSEGRVAQRLTEFRSVERARVAGEQAVNARLDAFHAAASKADGASYFACLAPDAIFIGTDATERWSVAQFRAYCEPYFAQGKGWTYTPSERHVYLSRDRATAWFDERLSNAKYGELRGSGAMRRDGERWLITQYVMSFPVPNDLSAELVKRIGERKR